MNQKMMWYGDKLKGNVRKRVLIGMNSAGRMLRNKAKILVNRGPGANTKNPNLTHNQRQNLHRAGGPRGPRSRVHSKPGEPPFAQSSTLQSNIDYEIDKSRKDAPGLFLGVIDGVEYARRLEFGGRYIKKRPYLRPTIFRNRDKIFQKIVGGK